MSRVHHTAIISPKAELDSSVQIGPYAVIGEKVKIGKNTIIGAHTVVGSNTIIGEENEIFPYASLGLDPQDLKYAGEETKLVIGDRNKIREFTTLNRGTIAAGETRIGNDNLFMAYVHIAHDCIVGNNCIFANAANLAGHVELGDYINIGGMTAVVQFLKIGSQAFIGAYTKLTKSVLPYVMIDGSPATTHGLNSVGLKRRNFSNEEISILKDAYKIIFRSNILAKEAFDLLKEKYPEDKNIKYLIDFADTLERGFIR